jgi:hypothetical protein
VHILYITFFCLVVFLKKRAAGVCRPKSTRRGEKVIARTIRVEARTLKSLEQGVAFAKDVFSLGNLVMGGSGLKGTVIYQLIYW